ncbi:MAG: hypothetical protein J0H06_14930 [Actinobacteria bacterium]|nr:hypothetical protein [Actinomycetota bacterium]
MGSGTFRFSGSEYPEPSLWRQSITVWILFQHFVYCSWMGGRARDEPDASPDRLQLGTFGTNLAPGITFIGWARSPATAGIRWSVPPRRSPTASST